MKKIVLIGAAVLAASFLLQANEIDYRPKVNGVLRTCYEGEWQDKTQDNPDESGYLQRFQVRNARLKLSGNLLRQLDYYMQVDLCDRGKMKFLDAWARWHFTPEFAVKAGQYRVPFGVDAFRAPGNYLFANRSFIGKQMANLRQVGVQLGYYGTRIPLTLEAGVFNSAPMADHDVWQKDMDFAAKASYRLPANFTASVSFLSMKPYDIRQNLVDAALGWSLRNVSIAGEYQHLHYADTSLPATDAWLATVNWAIPLRKSVFDKANLNGRFDSMTDRYDGKTYVGGPGAYDPSRRRLTLGGSLSKSVGKAKFELMLNYEKYFYNSGVSAPRGDSDKILAELIVTF